MSNNNLLRITQIDAIHLDKEIYKTLTQLVQQCIIYLPPGSMAYYESELNLLIQLLISHYSIVKSGSTFGQQLLAIKYNDIPFHKRCFYVLFNCLHYFKYKSEILPGHLTIFRLINYVDAFIKITSLINISFFLRTGKKPLLIDRLLNLEQVYARENAQRQFGSKYLARELLWNSLIEVLVYVLPLVNYHKVKRIVRKLNPFKKDVVNLQPGNAIITLQTNCVHCGKPPILPYQMGCTHVFCYICLKGNQIADPKYSCPKCNYSSVTINCERVKVI